MTFPSQTLTMFGEADCFKIYQDVRRDVAQNCLQLGQGYNRYVPSPIVPSLLRDSLRYITEVGRLQQYSCDEDMVERELYAELVARRFGLGDLRGSDVFFTNGGTEAISVLTGAMRALDYEMALPIPTYYAYEQSAIRYGIPVSVRYRHDGQKSGPITQRSAVVSVFPNGVAGNAFVLPPGLRQAGFHIMDVIFQLATPQQMAALERPLREALKASDLTRTALVLTPSKDLSVPSIRAGAVITRNPLVQEFLQRDRNERSFTVSPMVAHICLLHGALSLLYSAWTREGDSGFNSEYAWISRRFVDSECPVLPSALDCMVALTHLAAMADHCDSAADLIRESSECFVDGSIDDRIAGYSCFPRLRLLIDDHTDLVRIANRWGRQSRLKVNPTVLFGGTLESWDLLYPREARIRVNLSVPQDELKEALAMLAACLRSEYTVSNSMY